MLFLSASLVALSLLQPAPLFQSGATPRQVADDILETRGDEKPYRFEELAKFGSKASVKQLIRVCDDLPLINGSRTSNLPVRRGIEAFELYRENKELAQFAIPYLVECAQSEELFRVEVAVNVLAKYGALAEEELAELAEDATTEDGRAEAVRASLSYFSSHPTAEYLERVLAHYRSDGTSTRAKLTECLAAFPEELALPVFDKYVKGEARTGMLARVLLTVGAYNGGAADAQLEKWLKLKNTQVQLGALRTLRARGAGHHLKAAEKLTKSKDPVVRLQALCEVCRLRIDEPAWQKKMESLSRSRDHIKRQAVARMASLLTWNKALALLEPLCADSHSAVRSQAYRGLEVLRRPACVEILIERLKVEEDALKYRSLASLQNLTGETLGITASSWERWWQEVGSKEPLPSASKVAKLVKARSERRMENMTKSVFFGLPMHSRRAVFVVDNSGSMGSSLKRKKSKEESEGRSKREAATKQMIQTLKALPDETLVNMIYFGTSVASWRDELVRLTPDSRREALEYIADPGGTGLTALYDALESAFAIEGLDTLYLLTDGRPHGGKIDDPSVIRAMVAEWNGVPQITIHCISLGRDSDLLRAIADDSGGQYRFVME